MTCKIHDQNEDGYRLIEEYLLKNKIKEHSFCECGQESSLLTKQVNRQVYLLKF